MLAPIGIKSLIELTDEAIDFKSSTGEILAWSKGAERFYGYAASEILGSPAVDLNFSRDRDSFLSMLKLAEASRQSQCLTVLRRRKDGGYFPVRLSVSPLIDDKENEFFGFLGRSEPAYDCRTSLESAFAGIIEHDLLSYLHDVDRIISLFSSLESFNSGEQELLLRLKQANDETRKYLSDLALYGRLNVSFSLDIEEQSLNTFIRRLEPNPRFDVTPFSNEFDFRVRISAGAIAKVLEILSDRLILAGHSAARPRLLVQYEASAGSIDLKLICLGTAAMMVSAASYMAKFDDCIGHIENGLGRKGLALARLIADIHCAKLEFFRNSDSYGFILRLNVDAPFSAGECCE